MKEINGDLASLNSDEFKGFREYVNYQAKNTYHVGGWIQRMSGLHARVEFSGPKNNCSEFFNFLRRMREEEPSIITDLVVERVTQNVSSLYLASRTFSIKKDINRHARRGLYSDEKYNNDASSYSSASCDI